MHVIITEYIRICRDHSSTHEARISREMVGVFNQDEAERYLAYQVQVYSDHLNLSQQQITTVVSRLLRSSTLGDIQPCSCGNFMIVDTVDETNSMMDTSYVNLEQTEINTISDLLEESSTDSDIPQDENAQAAELQRMRTEIAAMQSQDHN